MSASTGELGAARARQAENPEGDSRPEVSGSTATAGRPAVLSGEGLRVRYDGKLVLDVQEISLRSGELLAVLGPNGAGKSTLMRVLAMLERPASGRVTFGGRSGRAAERALRRSSAAVFQRPHYWRDSVARNIGIGLRIRGAPVPEISEHVERIAGLLGISDLLGRDVASLSGGQAQRVALARALVLKPDILFLDEPTANLDTASRMELRDDLERIARQRAGTILLVTHDRSEAFYLADRIAVVVEGRIIQIGTPAELFEDPADSYIARVTGAEFTLKGRVVGAEDGVLLVDIDGTLLRTVGAAADGATVKVAYRPEDLVLSPPDATPRQLSTRNAFYATVVETRELGGLVRLRLDGPPDMVASVTRSARDELGLEPGARLSVRIKATALHTFPAGTGGQERPDDAGPPVTREID